MKSLVTKTRKILKANDSLEAFKHCKRNNKIENSAPLFENSGNLHEIVKNFKALALNSHTIKRSV